MKFFATLGMPSGTLPKLAEVGVSVAGGTPVPLKGTACGLFAALSLMSRVALSALKRLGVNVTPMVHFAPGAMLAGQLLTWVKSPEFAPEIVMLTFIKFVVPVLVSVTFFIALAVWMS